MYEFNIFWKHNKHILIAYFLSISEFAYLWYLKVRGTRRWPIGLEIDSDLGQDHICQSEFLVAMCEVHVCLAPVDTNHWCKLSTATLKTPASPPTCGKQEVNASSAHKSRGQGASGYPVSCCITPHPYQERSTALWGHSDGQLPRLAILKTPSQLTIYSAQRKIYAPFC